MKRLLAALMLVTLMALAAAMPAAAYSYGDPNEEALAVMFKDASAKIQSGDWEGASPLYQAKRAEIESHFGPGIAETLDNNFAAKNKEDTLQNLKALMVLNLERRFEYGAKGIEDYSQSKLLLAKARATYDALEPYVQAKLPDETAKLRSAFDAALEALGNPGLFGVGKKDVNPEEFNKQTAYVINTVRPLFPLKDAKTGAPAADKSAATPAPQLADGAGQAPAATNQADGGHAPMKREDKTNKTVTFAVIGGVALAAGGAVWWARRKGML